jgi:predicted dehydrogenase
MVEFRCGAIITVITSFEVYKHGHWPIEIYGSEGALQVPDPNTFCGPVRIFRNGYKDFECVPLSHIYTENSRSIGAADMAYALQSGRKHRPNGEFANHVLEIMLSFDKSGKLGKKVEMTTTCERPAPLPMGMEHGTLDL